MSGIRLKIVALKLSLLAACGGFVSCTSLPVAAVNPNTRAVQPATAEQKAIAALEMSCFQRTFDFDTDDKRLKRLELFVAGVSNSGTSSQRIAQIKEALTRHEKKGPLTPTKRNIGQSIDVLEKSILRKTSPTLQIDERLAILEKKVFGAAFPNIPVEQRLHRLQKTIGTGEEDVAELPTRRYQSFSVTPDSLFNSPFGSPLGSPYGTPDDMNMDPDIRRHMSEMFDHLNSQLKQLHRMPSNSFGYPPELPKQFLLPDRRNGFSDGLPPGNFDIRQEKQSLPPYMDPNSI